MFDEIRYSKKKNTIHINAYVHQYLKIKKKLKIGNRI